MDDADNEVLDWENEDDEQMQSQDGDSRRQSLAEVDADDAVSLGDEDEQPSALDELEPQGRRTPQIYAPNADTESRDQEQGHSRNSFNGSQRANQDSGDKRTPRVSDHRRRSSRSSPQRSQATIQPPARLTHALPPKPTLAVAAAAASPAARVPTQKGNGTRAAGSESHSRNPETTSPSYSSKRPRAPTDWEARVSSKGDTYFYNTSTRESTWSKPANYRPPPTDSGSDDGRNGAYHVSSSTTFRSSPTVSDRASQDAHPQRPEPDTSRNAPRHSRDEPPRDRDRRYEPEREPTGQARYYRGDESHSRDPADIGRGSDAFIERGSSGMGPPQRDYAPPRDRDLAGHPSGPTRRDRDADNAREQKAYPEDDSRRRSRFSTTDTYTPAEDTRPAPSRRPSSPPRGLQSQAADRPPIAAPRRRPSPPLPPFQPSRPGPETYGRRPYEHAQPSAPLPKEPRASRDTRDEHSNESRRVSAAPAAPEYPRSRTPIEIVRVRQAKAEQRQRELMGAPTAQELEVHRSSNTVSAGYDDRRSIYAEHAYPPKQRSAEGSGYRPPEPSQQAVFTQHVADTRGMDRSLEERERIGNKRPVNDDRDDPSSYRARRRRTRSLTPERYHPLPVTEPEKPKPQPRDYYEPLPPPVARRESYPSRDYPPPHQYSAPPHPERQAEYSRPPVVEDNRPRGGPVSRPVEPPDAYNSRSIYTQERERQPPPQVREVYKESIIPKGPRESISNEPPRGPRRDASPGKRKKAERDREAAARKMTSGTNALPLGKNRYANNNESVPPSAMQPLPTPLPPQRYPEPPQSEPPSRRERFQGPDVGRRDVYERLPEPVHYPERQSATVYQTSRRPTPPPQDYPSRASDPISRPPHMAEPRREPAANYHPAPRREPQREYRERDRSRSPPPPHPRNELYPPPESRRQPNGESERRRPPNSPDLSRNISSSTFAGSTTSRASESGPPPADVDSRSDRYRPPSDRFRDSLTVSSNGGSAQARVERDLPLAITARPLSYHPLPAPPANLPPNPMLTGRDQRATDPPEKSPETTRWNDRPLPPHIKSDVPLPLVAPRPPLSPTASKKMLSGAEISPPRLRRPSVVVDRKVQEEPATRERERDRGPDNRERVERDREWDRERERDRGKERDYYDRPPSRAQPPPPIARGPSLLERIKAPSPTPTLIERVSRTVPMKRSSELMSNEGAMEVDDLYSPVDDSSDYTNKKRRRGGGGGGRRGRNPGAKRS